MPNKLSYSQIQKYKYCSQAWNYHYQLRVRPTAIPSPLIFGSAIGKTFEHAILQKFNDTLTESAESFFDRHWLEQEVNGVMTVLKDNPNVVYSKSDLDEELASTPWESLRAKAHLMIEAFRSQFLPLVTKVYSTEELVELSSGEDSNIGYADAVVDIIGYDTPIVMDFKTSARKYEPNSVRESVQLSQYLYTLGPKYGTELAGYAVFLKNINKNRQKICKECGFDGSGTKFKTCNVEYYKNKDDKKTTRCNGEWNETIHPTCNIQIIIDSIPLEIQEATIDDIGLVNDSINTGVIEKNLEACHNDYGKPCIYMNLCHGGSMDGLIVLEKKNEL